MKQKISIKTWIVVALFAVAAVLSAIFMNDILINYNLADYLNKDTQTKIALDIIENEFGMTGNLQVFAKNVSVETAKEIKSKIEKVPNVINVNFDETDASYYKADNALFIVIIDGDDYSDNAKQVASDVKNALSEYEGMQYAGTTVEKQALQDSITNEMVYILAISLCLVVAILLITSKSWLEPLVLLASSGIAILLNRGTNVFFGEISYITNSISAILQLALSIDYSIVLLNAYRKEKENTADSSSAMTKAVKSVIKPISASSLTTIAGLLALLFMSFKIGFDIGIVLMKGIVISAITSVTLLPALAIILDKAMVRTRKKAFEPKGTFFCKTAIKAHKAIVPIALAVIIACAFLQTGNQYSFSDEKAGNQSIIDTFGNNNSVVVVYKNSADNFKKEQEFANTVAKYNTKDGKAVLANYTAYTNTAKELYSVEKAAQKLNLSDNDIMMLYTMYHLYGNTDAVKMTFSQFINFANELIDADSDAKDFADENTTAILNTLKSLSYLTTTKLTAEEMHGKITELSDSDVKLFSVSQLYGLYFYNSVQDKSVDFMTMLEFILEASQSEEIGYMFDEKTIKDLNDLYSGVANFLTQMTQPTNKTALNYWLSQNGETTFTDAVLDTIWENYFNDIGEAENETIPFLPLINYIAKNGFVDKPMLSIKIAAYDNLFAQVSGKYKYTEFLPTVTKVATAATGTAPQITVSEQAVQQLYIMYFYRDGRFPVCKMTGKTFAEYALNSVKTNSILASNLTEENRSMLADMLTVNKYVADKTLLTFESLHSQISALQSEINTEISVTSDADTVSGVYIKYAIHADYNLTSPIMACDLLDFVSKNMDKNSLLKKKMTDDNRNKVVSAQKDIMKATDLFCGENYSRLLLSVNLPNESADTTEFVEYLSKTTKEIFGNDAYITGEIVSTYDLEKSFRHDNLFITVFTLISIFVIVLAVFRSLSLPVILVAIIQGAIFIAMSTQLFGHGIFFMSYIVSTCILMGATIDYGILMSSNYVGYRSVYNKEQALNLSVQAAIPTVFSSGLILTICGFVIYFVSSQFAISTVGLLIGIGTICSIVMITFALPSVLYSLDKFVLALSLKKKK